MNTLRSVFAVLHSTPGDKATEGTSVIYQITRYEIENCLIDRIVQDLRGANKKPLCRCAMGEMTFIVEGYDDDQRVAFNALCETSGVSQKDAEKRVQDVLKRFGNPLQK